MKKAKALKAQKLKAAKAKAVKAKKLKAAKIKAAAKKKASLKKKPVRKAAPKKPAKVTVESLLTKKDQAYIQENSIKNVSVKIDGEVFSVSQRHQVPKNAEIIRNQQGQVTGTKAIVGG